MTRPILPEQYSLEEGLLHYAEMQKYEHLFRQVANLGKHCLHKECNPSDVSKNLVEIPIRNSPVSYMIPIEHENILKDEYEITITNCTLQCQLESLLKDGYIEIYTNSDIPGVEFILAKITEPTVNQQESFSISEYVPENGDHPLEVNFSDLPNNLWKKIRNLEYSSGVQSIFRDSGGESVLEHEQHNLKGFK